MDELVQTAIVHAIQSAHLLATFDPDGTIVDCNEIFVRTLGFSDKSELIGRQHRTLVEEQDTPQASNYLWGGVVECVVLIFVFFLKVCEFLGSAVEGEREERRSATCGQGREDCVLAGSVHADCV
jgi:PAS domain-containing protein